MCAGVAGLNAVPRRTYSLASPDRTSSMCAGVAGLRATAARTHVLVSPDRASSTCVGATGFAAAHLLNSSGKSDRLEPGCAANPSSASGHAPWVRASLIRVFVIFMVFMLFSHLAASRVAGHGGA